jgi:hypothetical protein
MWVEVSRRRKAGSRERYFYVRVDRKLQPAPESLPAGRSSALLGAAGRGGVARTAAASVPAPGLPGSARARAVLADGAGAAGTHRPARAAVRIVGEDVHAARAAAGQSGGARALAVHAALRARANVAASAAVVGVGVSVHASRAADHLAGAATAGAVLTGFGRGAFRAAAAAVVVVGQWVRADGRSSAAAAELLALSAATAPENAGFGRRALGAAGAAVVGVGREVRASGAARGAGGAPARAADAYLRGRTGFVAGTAMRRTRPRVDATDVVADDLPARTARSADSAVADVAAGAGLAAAAAVLRVGLDVRGDPGAVVVFGRALADPADTRQAGGANVPAVPAVVGVVREVHTRATTLDEAGAIPPRRSRRVAAGRLGASAGCWCSTQARDRGSASSQDQGRAATVRLARSAGADSARLLGCGSALRGDGRCRDQEDGKEGLTGKAPRALI